MNNSPEKPKKLTLSVDVSNDTTPMVIEAVDSMSQDTNKYTKTVLKEKLNNSFQSILENDNGKPLFVSQYGTLEDGESRSEHRSLIDSEALTDDITPTDAANNFEAELNGKNVLSDVQKNNVEEYINSIKSEKKSLSGLSFVSELPELKDNYETLLKILSETYDDLEWLLETKLKTTFDENDTLDSFDNLIASTKKLIVSYRDELKILNERNEY